jgi:hypothetical protein
MGMPGMNHGGGAPAEAKKPASTDHSEHQPGVPQTPQTKPEDHSQHQPKVQKPEDHSQHQKKPSREILYWYSVMHPEVVSDKPGKCPKCGMDLVPKYADEKGKK